MIPNSSPPICGKHINKLEKKSWTWKDRENFLTDKKSYIREFVSDGVMEYLFPFSTGSYVK